MIDHHAFPTPFTPVTLPLVETITIGSLNNSLPAKEGLLHAADLLRLHASHLELNLMIHDNNDGESHKIVAQRIEELTTVGVMMG